jgi:dihydroorotase
MAAGDAAGFQFALDVLERETVLRTEMMQSLRSQFPELKGSDEDTIKAFLKARSGN